jgi:hypothetical protein
MSVLMKELYPGESLGGLKSDGASDPHEELRDARSSEHALTL